MTDHLNLIRIKLQHLSRMGEYLAYSLSQVESILKLKDWAALSPDQHESLAAFRVRFSEFPRCQYDLLHRSPRDP